MNDRLIRGTLAALLGSLFIILNNNVSYYVFHFSRALWVQMLSYLGFGHAAKSFAEHVMAFALLFIVVGGLGYIYAWVFVPRPGEGNYYFRAVGLGLGFWLASNVLGSLFRIHLVDRIAWETALTNLISVIGWGLITGYVMKRWDRVYG